MKLSKTYGKPIRPADPVLVEALADADACTPDCPPALAPAEVEPKLAALVAKPPVVLYGFKSCGIPSCTEPRCKPVVIPTQPSTTDLKGVSKISQINIVRVARGLEPLRQLSDMAYVNPTTLEKFSNVAIECATLDPRIMDRLVSDMSQEVWYAPKPQYYPGSIASYGFVSG